MRRPAWVCRLFDELGIPRPVGRPRKLTAAQRREAAKMSRAEIMARYGVSRATATRVRQS